MAGNIFSGKVEHLLLMAMGPTWYQCPQRDKLPPPPKLEVWGINTLYRSYNGFDRLFMMHDIRTEILLNDYDFVNSVNKEKFPVYTAGDYPCLKNNIPYPMEEILNEFQVGYFLNSISYMIALAVKMRPKSISLFGIDMRPDSHFEWHMNEKGCVEFWLGAAVSRGIKVDIPKESYVLRRAITGAFYGFMPRAVPDGLVQFVPANDRRRYNRYKLTPVDNEGNELSDPIIITPKAMEGHTDNATYDKGRTGDLF